MEWNADCPIHGKGLENKEPSELSHVKGQMELLKACNEAAALLASRQGHPRIPLGAERQNIAEVIRQTVVSFTQPVIDFAEWGWTIIANAGGGDWEKESPDWQEAAAKYRDDFHNKIRHYVPSVPSGTDSSSAMRVSSEKDLIGSAEKDLHHQSHRRVGDDHDGNSSSPLRFESERTKSWSGEIPTPPAQPSPSTQVIERL